MLQDSLNVVKSECESLRSSKEMLSKSLDQKSKELDEVIHSQSLKFMLGSQILKTQEDEEENVSEDEKTDELMCDDPDPNKKDRTKTLDFKTVLVQAPSVKRTSLILGEQNHVEISFLQNNIKMLQAQFVKEQENKKEMDKKLVSTQTTMEQKIKWLEKSLNDEKSRSSTLHLSFNEKEKVFLKKIEDLEQNLQNLTKSYTQLSNEKTEDEKKIRKAKEVEKVLCETQIQFKKYLENIESFKRMLNNPSQEGGEFNRSYRRSTTVGIIEDNTSTSSLNQINSPMNLRKSSNYDHTSNPVSQPMTPIGRASPSGPKFLDWEKPVSIKDFGDNSEGGSMNKSMLATPRVTRSKIIKPLKGGGQGNIFQIFLILVKAAVHASKQKQGFFKSKTKVKDS